mmetsp:Transcript_40690/g.83233  ORF Transcript_40690/g.83233 Transcript_40690/m.83233 type:complete len:222 (+) Transcript_40690:208-873(+)
MPAKLLHENLRDDANKHQPTAHPLRLVQRVVGVAEDGVDGGEDLSRRRDRREDERAELDNSVVDEALAHSRREPKHRERHQELGALLAKVDAILHLAGGETERKRHHRTRRVGVEHALERRHLGRLSVLAILVLGGWVHARHRRLHRILDAASKPVEHEGGDDEREAVRGVRASALAGLHWCSHVEDHDADSDDADGEELDEGRALLVEEDSDEEHRHHLA